MNTKTTLVLALVAVVVAGYVLFVDKPWEAQQVKTDETAKSTAVALYEPRFEDPDKVEITQRGGKTLAFVKKDEGWLMTSPIEAPATEYQVKNVIDKVAEIKYMKKYAPGDKDLPKETITGLKEPIAVVRLAKGDKELAKVTVGKELPTGKGNYILAGASQDVLESQNKMSDVFTGKVDSFRDKAIVKFDVNDVKRVTVEGDRNFVLVKNGEEWVMELPMRARTDKSKAEGVARALSNLYVTDFKDNAPVSYKSYELQPPRMKVTIATEKKIPPKAKPGDPNTKPADIEPSVKQASYALEIGGPATQDGKQFFARLSDKPGVFAINDYTVKQIGVDITELQDKKLATVTQAKIKSIKSDTPEGTITLTKKDNGGWVDAENRSADLVAVEDLIKAANSLQATKFIDPKAEIIKLDWEKPRARVSFTQEGSLNPITLLVGPASASGKMVFVRNAAEEAVAAVPEDAVAQLIAPPVAYRDRAVMRFDRPRANKVEIAQAGKQPIVLTQKNNQWSMSAPVEGSVDSDAVRNLMQDVSALQAKSVAGMGDKARFGLNAPKVTLAVHVDPIKKPQSTQPAAAVPAATQPATTRPASTRPAKPLAEQIKNVEDLLEYQKTNPNAKAEATEFLKKRLAELKAQSQPASVPAASVAGAAQPATAAQPAVNPDDQPRVYRLLIAQKDGKVYAALDGNEMIYELDIQVLTDATVEFHDRQVSKFETAEVSDVEFGVGDKVLNFRKTGEDWKYVADPVLPIDKEKVNKALDDFKDLKTDAFVSYSADSLVQYGLESPAKRVMIVLGGGKRIEVLVSAKGPQDDKDKSVYACLAGQKKVFLLKGDQAAKFDRKLDDFEKKAGESTPPPPGGMQGMPPGGGFGGPGGPPPSFGQ